MHICIPISIHSLFGHVLPVYGVPFYFNAHAYMYTCFRCKVLQQQNMLNVHYMPFLVCEVFKWNYEQHLYGHTVMSMVYSFASTNEPLSNLAIIFI